MNIEIINFNNKLYVKAKDILEYITLNCNISNVRLIFDNVYPNQSNFLVLIPSFNNVKTLYLDVNFLQFLNVNYKYASKHKKVIQEVIYKISINQIKIIKNNNFDFRNQNKKEPPRNYYKEAKDKADLLENLITKINAELKRKYGIKLCIDYQKHIFNIENINKTDDKSPKGMYLIEEKIEGKQGFLQKILSYLS